MPANIIHVRTGLVLNDIEQVGMSLSVNYLIFLKRIITIFYLFKKKLDDSRAGSSKFFGVNSNTFQKETREREKIRLRKK
jgi:hypothetical protein